MEVGSVDAHFSDEFQVLKQAGHACHVFSVEHWEDGLLKIKPAIPVGQKVLYRGWMMKLPEYAQLQAKLAERDAQLLISTEQYKSAHYLSSWYPHCQQNTPETVFLHDEDLVETINRLNWSAYFVKDQVKSLTTTRGSKAKTAAEIREILSELLTYRGEWEGGICIRRWEDLIVESEERFFIWKGRAYCKDGNVPPWLGEMIPAIGSPFFSMDIAFNRQGKPRIVEIGDGQVSSIKNWPLDAFVHIFAGE
ncbi:MAG: ATP-grasp domain-containing protein [Acidobacteria bacterium]|nr:ATP-grasp domain-containing protein [Acidobacteriota bacterium]